MYCPKCREEIDQHPAGWSSINGVDWDQEPGFIEGFNKPEIPRPQCYCHGDRSEEAQPVNEDTDAGMEWAYVFDEEHRAMYVLERMTEGHHMVGMFGYGAEGNQTWVMRARVDLDGPEPDWEAIRESGWQESEVEATT